MRDTFREFSYPELTTASFVLLDLFPIVFLVYTVNFEELKEKWMDFRGKRKMVAHSEIIIMIYRSNNIRLDIQTSSSCISAYYLLFICT